MVGPDPALAAAHPRRHAGRRIRPIVQVIDNFARNHKLGVLFEARVGRGQLLVVRVRFARMTKDPAARQLLASLYAYAGSAAFKPTQQFSDDLLEKLFVPKFANKLQALGATIRADSQENDYAAANAIDGDPQTMWHTPWEGPAPRFPHELVVEFPKPVRVAGLTCLPRQDGNHNGWIKDYAVHSAPTARSGVLRWRKARSRKTTACIPSSFSQAGGNEVPETNRHQQL